MAVILFESITAKLEKKTITWSKFGESTRRIKSVTRSLSAPIIVSSVYNIENLKQGHVVNSCLWLE